MKLTQVTVVALGVVASFAAGVFATQAPGARVDAAERFEVTSIKAVRPTLVKTIDALKKGDTAKAKDAFEAYDTAWNGIEVYINTRDKDMYNELEKNYQTKIEEGLKAPKPDVPGLLSNAQAMLAKYDQAIAMVEKAAPLNPLYDDIARVRTARSPLRNVNPAMKEGDVARARKAFAAFRANWPKIRDFVKMRSADAYDTVEKGIPDLDAALKGPQPSPDQVAGLVNGMMGKINGVAFQLTTEARKPA
jgi:tetratricopeptide (TPR) repeat protein